MIGAQTLSPANHRSGCHPRPRLRIIFQALQPVSLPLASTKLSSLVHKTVLWDERKGHEMLGQQSAFPSQVSCPTYREHLRAFDATTKIIIRASHHLESFERLELTARFSDRKSTRVNSSHMSISYAVFCLKKKTGGTPRHAPVPRVARCQGQHGQGG